jgi:hypothetical protein
MENKMGNGMSVIREKLETQIGDLCAGQAELEERLYKQQTNVTSMVEQQTWNMGENIEAQSGRSSNTTSGWRRSRSQQRYSETTEIRWCNVLGCIPPTV